MQLTIKKYEGQEEEQLKQLFYICFEDETLLNIVNRSRLKFAYSAILNNKLVGIAFLWTSNFHPYCTYFRILCNPFYSFLNIEEKLLSKVVELKTENVPLQTSIWETSTNLKSLYQNNGFKEIRRTYLTNLKVSDVSKYAPYHRGEYKFITLKEVIKNKELTGELVHLVKRIYENTHVENPVAKIEINKWWEMILADDVVSNGCYICLDRKRKNIIAYSFLHDSDEKDSLELGWCGTVAIEQKQLLSQLVLHQVKYAIKHDIQYIIGEFDTTDKYAMEVLCNFPFAPSPTWITYRQE